MRIPCWGHQHRLGAASQRPADHLAERGRRSPAGAICSRALSRTAAVTSLAETWRQVTAAAAVLPAVAPERDTYASAGRCRCRWTLELTRQVIGEVPAAFHAGVQDILLIAFGLAFQEFLGTGAVPIGIDVEGHGRDEELARDVDLSRTVGWFTAKYPVALHLGRSPGSRSLPGRPRWARVIKDAKGTAAGAAGWCDLRSAAVSEPRYRSRRRRSRYRIQLSGPPAGRASYPRTCGASTPTPQNSPPRRARSPPRWVTPWSSNAGTMDTEAGPTLHANWTYATSAPRRRPDRPAGPALASRPRPASARTSAPRRRPDLRHRPGPVGARLRSTSWPPSTTLPTSCR